MDARASLDPAEAQQIVAQYVTLLEEHTTGNALPAPTTSLPVPKPVIKDAVRTVVEALAVTDQLTGELQSFLEEAFVALANYVDPELAALAADYRRASEGLESDRRDPREKVESPNWAVLSRTSRLAGDIARSSADEAAALRQEFAVFVSLIRTERPGDG